MTLVQITQRKGHITRQPRGRVPVIELDLEANQTIVNLEVRSTEYRSARHDARKTVDWTWWAWIATRLGD